jgi:ABC-type uncharacterized transport system permease subunit
MERLALAGSTFCFLAGSAFTVYAMGARTFRPSRGSFWVILMGFVLQTCFLSMRGEVLGRCPLTNRFEVLVFLAWAMVLFYLLIGTAYRLSLLGLFTAPLALGIQLVALLVPNLDRQPQAMPTPNPWMEMHAALSVVAYGAFALAGVAGGMYLAQERQLKTHHLRSFFFALPPIQDLAVANRRLVASGFGLLTLGLLAGFAMEGWSAHWVKVVWSTVVWLMYGAILVAVSGHRMGGRRVAWLSLWAIGAVLGTLWSLRFLSTSGA